MPIDDEQLVLDFVSESQEHLANIERDILALEAGADHPDRDLVNRVFRAVHTVKGGAGFLGLTVIGELSHSLENVLNLIRNGEMAASAGSTNVLLSAADTLRNLLADVAASNTADVSAHVRALNELISGGVSEAVRESLERKSIVGAPGGPQYEISAHDIESQRQAGHHLYSLAFDLIADVQDQGRTPMQLVQDLVSLGEIIASAVDLSGIGDLTTVPPDEVRFNVLFGSVLEPDLVPEGLSIPAERIQAIDLTPTAAPATNSPPAAPSGGEASPAAPPATTTPVAVSAMPEAAPAAPQPVAPHAAEKPQAVPVAGPITSGKPTDTSIRVSVNLLDHLMNLAGELVLSRNQLLQALSSGRTDGVHSIGGQLDRITSELQESIMQTRMQQCGNVFNKFPRIVRDLSAQLGRQCQLVLHGTEVELDKSILEAIGDPLTHLIRNSVDHGVEPPDKRIAAGKSPTGTVTLSAFHQAGKVIIEIQDDGAGINVARVREKAIATGLVTADAAAELSDREIIQYIFLPGFSTAEKISGVSGRGVGMDVVRTNIAKIGGTVEIESTRGQGTTIRVKLPLTLAIIPSLIVRGGSERFAVPQSAISELVRVKATDARNAIMSVKDAEVLRLRGDLLPLVRLTRVLRTARGETPVDEAPEPSKATDAANEATNILVVETGHTKYGLIVDGLHDSEEIVVKPLGRHLKGVHCLAGATILGDGSVALILDIAGIARVAPLAAVSDDPSEQKTSTAGYAERETQPILLFANHPSERFAAPMVMIARIERIRREQITMVGGRAVLQYPDDTLTLIALEDCVRALPRPDQPRLYVVVFNVAGREVGLITPELIDIRQVPLDVDTATFSEPGILGSAVIDQRATRVVDIWALAQRAHPEWFTNRANGLTINGASPSVLLAEDSEFFRGQLNQFLESEGCRVCECPDGQIAWDTLRDPAKHFDLIVTDIEMPGLTGLELTRLVRNEPRWAQIPIIAVTSLSSAADARRATEAGVSEYQVKLDRNRLMQAVGRCLRSPERSKGAVAALAGAGGRN